MVRLVDVVFTGSLKLHDNGSWYRDTEPGKPQYVGLPSKEIDDAWNELLSGMQPLLSMQKNAHHTDSRVVGMNIDLSGDETESVRHKTFVWPGTDKHFTG